MHKQQKCLYVGVTTSICLERKGTGDLMVLPVPPLLTTTILK